MTKRTDTREPSAVALGGESLSVWQRVGDEVLAGIHHALNNRVGALSAVAQVLAEEMQVGHPLRSALADEVGRLQRTVCSLALLPQGQITAEPILLSEGLRGVTEIYAYHPAARDVPCEIAEDADLLPVCVPPAQLVQALVALAVTVAKAAPPQRAAVRLACTGDAEQVAIVVEQVGVDEEAEVRTGEERMQDREWIETAVRARVEEMGGSLHARMGAGGAPRFEVRLPTLPAVRRKRPVHQEG